MHAADVHASLVRLFAELVDGAAEPRFAFILNTGDAGLLKSLERLPAADASRSAHGGATIAAHAQHLRYGLSLMNRWAAEGGDPFADARWDAAWTISTVDDAAWREIREGLDAEAHRWVDVLKAGASVTGTELTGMIASVAHLAYHLGAIRQISKETRGPKEGTF